MGHAIKKILGIKKPEQPEVVPAPAPPAPEQDATTTQESAETQTTSKRKKMARGKTSLMINTQGTNASGIGSGTNV